MCMKCGSIFILPVNVSLIHYVHLCYFFILDLSLFCYCSLILFFTLLFVSSLVSNFVFDVAFDVVFCIVSDVMLDTVFGVVFVISLFLFIIPHNSSTL